MRYECSRKPRKCAGCGSTRIASILYGMPIFSPELEADMNAGRVALGGCCVMEDDPVWQCAGCQVLIFKTNSE